MNQQARELSTSHAIGLELAERGFALLPLNGKVPVLGDWVNAASSDKHMIDLWAGMHKDCNWGIATGRELPGGGRLVVIDVDRQHGGEESIRKLFAKLGPISSMRVKTGQGGVHIYTRVTMDADIRNLQDRAGDWKGVDVRGIGGQVVAPGSVHPDTGVIYEEIEGDIAWCSREWQSALKGDGGYESLKARVDPDATVSEGDRNNDLIRLAGAMRRQGCDEATIHAGLMARTNTAHAQPLDEREVLAVARSSARYTPEPDPIPTVESASLVDSLPELLKTDGGAAVEPAMLAALRLVRDTDKPGYERARDVLRKYSKLRSVENELKLLDQIDAKRRAEEAATAIEPAADAPERHLVPEPWAMGESGIWGPDKEGVPTRICASDLYIPAHLHNIAEGPERIQLTFKQHGAYRTISTDRTNVASRQSIVALSADGLDVTSENAGQLVRFISDLSNANPDVPVLRHTSKTGWLGSSHFYPGAADGIVYDPGESDQTMAKAFEPCGDADEWLTMAAKLRAEWPLVRLMMAASYAAPLISKLGQRAFILNIHGQSGGGKTAGMTAAISAWGNPSVLVGGFNATEYYMAQRAVALSDTMLCLNERQSVGNKKMSTLIYTLIEGVSRGQGARTGGTKPTLRWKNTVLVNGEEPLTPMCGTAGTANRVLDVYGRPIDDNDQASAVYNDFAACYGHGGPLYIAGLVKHLDGRPERLREEYELVSEALAGECSSASKAHVASMASMVLAGSYEGQFVFGETQKDSLAASVENGVNILREIDGLEAGEDYRGAYEFILQLMAANRDKFHEAVSDSSWGFTEGRRAYIFPFVLRRELDDFGYPYMAVLQWLADKDLIKTEKNGKEKRRLTYRKKGVPMVNLALPRDFRGQEDIQEDM